MRDSRGGVSSPRVNACEERNNENMKTKLKKFGAWLMAVALAFAGAGAGLA